MRATFRFHLILHYVVTLMLFVAEHENVIHLSE
jgi:hypothetical protein